MKTMILVFLFLSVFFTLLVAQPARLSREEEDRRSKELRALGEQFKKETGFQGYLSHDTTLNKISRFRGRFPDLTFPPASEKEEVGLIFDEVLKRILPYLSVPREQLTRENVTGDDSLVRVQYTQRINGYDLEGGGRIRFFYNYKINELGMTNSLKKIHPSTLAVEPVITRVEALEIYNKTAEIRKGWLPFLDRYKPHPHLMYCYLRDDDQDFPLIPYQYRLSWFIAHVGNQFIIDAITGEILFNKEVVMYETETYNGNGTSNNSF